jgi:hypothetical protein
LIALGALASKDEGNVLNIINLPMCFLSSIVCLASMPLDAGAGSWYQVPWMLFPGSWIDVGLATVRAPGFLEILRLLGELHAHEVIAFVPLRYYMRCS